MSKAIRNETPEQLCNRLLQKQGFLVIASTAAGPLKRGQIVRSIHSGEGEGLKWLHHPVVVMGESNAEEWNQQRALQGLPPEFGEALFYRVTAE